MLESKPEKTKIIRVGDSKVAESRLRTIKYKDKEIRELRDRIHELKSRIEIYAVGGVPINDEIVLAGKKIAIGGKLIKNIKVWTKNGINLLIPPYIPMIRPSSEASSRATMDHIPRLTCASPVSRSKKWRMSRAGTCQSNRTTSREPRLPSQSRGR